MCGVSGEAELNVVDRMNAGLRPSRRNRPGALLLALLLGLIGVWFVIGGAWLLALGGSAYYVLAGAACLIIAGLYVRGSSYALTGYLGIFVLTCIWAVIEVGFDVWQLMPRIAWALALAV